MPCPYKETETHINSKSSVHTQESHIHTHKSLAYTKRALHTRKRALNTLKRAMYTMTTADTNVSMNLGSKNCSILLAIKYYIIYEYNNSWTITMCRKSIEQLILQESWRIEQYSAITHMGWLQLVGSIKLQVSFAKETYKRDAILQKRPINLSIQLTVATPYEMNRTNIQQLR